MSINSLKWDRYFSITPFGEIRELSPDLSSRRMPTTYTPDRKLLYLSSQDIYVETNEIDVLRRALEDIKNSYKIARKNSSIGLMNAAISRIDFIEVCGLLSRLVNLSGEYNDPDELLEELSSEGI